MTNELVVIGVTFLDKKMISTNHVAKFKKLKPYLNPPERYQGKFCQEIQEYSFAKVIYSVGSEPTFWQAKPSQAFFRKGKPSRAFCFQNLAKLSFQFSKIEQFLTIFS